MSRAAVKRPRSVAPQSERRVKVAQPVVTQTTLQLTPLEQRVLERRRFQKRDADDLIAMLRSQLAELWWYADRTLTGSSGVTPGDARDEMAHLACQMGMDLNQLASELRALAAIDREYAVDLGEVQP